MFRTRHTPDVSLRERSPAPQYHATATACPDVQPQPCRHAIQSELVSKFLGPEPEGISRHETIRQRDRRDPAARAAVAPTSRGADAVDAVNPENPLRRTETDRASLHLRWCLPRAGELASTPTPRRGDPPNRIKIVTLLVTTVLLAAAYALSPEGCMAYSSSAVGRREHYANCLSNDPSPCVRRRPRSGLRRPRSRVGWRIDAEYAMGGWREAPA